MTVASRNRSLADRRRPSCCLAILGQHVARHLLEGDLLRPADVLDAIDRRTLRHPGDLVGQIRDGDRLDQRVRHAHLVANGQRRGDGIGELDELSRPHDRVSNPRLLDQFLLRGLRAHVAAVGQLIAADDRHCDVVPDSRVLAAASRFVVEVVKNSITGSSSKDGALATSTTTPASVKAWVSPSPVSALTPGSATPRPRRGLDPAAPQPLSIRARLSRRSPRSSSWHQRYPATSDAGEPHIGRQ